MPATSHPTPSNSRLSRHALVVTALGPMTSIRIGIASLAWSDLGRGEQGSHPPTTCAT